MRLKVDRKLTLLGSYLPAGILRTLLYASLGSRRVALMFHRVRSANTGDVNLHLSIREEDLDAAIAFMLAAFPRRTERWLTATFDDGYDDAAAYVESRAHRFPAVDFILFVCPEKAERGVGFRWDLAERSRQEGEPQRRVAEILYALQDVETENAREDLSRIAADPQFRLASVDRLRMLAGLPNVSLGNHTNCHFELSLLKPDQARLELERSRACFERLFGRQRHFAFPFGHGFFDESHVRLLRTDGSPVLWGTGQSPYASADLANCALLPRIGIDGPSSFRGVATVVAGRSLITRAVGVRSISRRGERLVRRPAVR